jgi:hypothetical protein
MEKGSSHIVKAWDKKYESVVCKMGLGCQYVNKEPICLPWLGTRLGGGIQKVWLRWEA